MQHNICNEIRITSNIIRRYVNSSLGGSPDKTTCMRGMIIAFISSKGKQDVFQKDIEKEFFIRRSTATTILKKMEAECLIIRQPMKRDSRLKKIILTDKAKETERRKRLEIQKYEDNLLQCLTDEEIEQFYKIIKKIQKRAEIK